MSLTDDYLDILQEVKKTSITKTTRQAKIKRTTSHLASIEARKRGDSLYRQMKKYCEMCKKYRKKIHKKYSPRVRSRARR